MSLKPCPFCGSEPMLSERLNYVTCSNELCVIGNTISVWFLPEQWNTRAPTAETARADRYKSALESIVGQTDDQFHEGVWREVNSTAQAALEERA